MISGGDPITALMMTLGLTSTMLQTGITGNPMSLLGLLGPLTLGAGQLIGPAVGAIAPGATNVGGTLGESLNAANMAVDASNFGQAAAGGAQLAQSGATQIAPSLAPSGIGFTIDPALAAAGSGLPVAGVPTAVSTTPSIIGSPDISNITQPGYDAMSSAMPVDAGVKTIPQKEGLFGKIGNWLNPTADVAGKSPMEAIMAMQHASRQGALRQGILSGGLQGLASMGASLFEKDPYTGERNEDPERTASAISERQAKDTRRRTLGSVSRGPRIPSGQELAARALGRR